MIDSLTANPAVVAGFQLCGATGTMLSVVVTDDEAVESVVIEWSYPAVTAIGGPPGTAKGTLDLTHVAGTDMWQAPVSFWQQPVEEPQAFIALRVTAIDNDHLSWWRTFNTTLAIKHC